MDLELSNRRVIVTGASRGIGLEVARRFLEEGSRVALIARNEPMLVKSVEELATVFRRDHLLWFAGDCAEISNWIDICAEILEKWQGIDVVVANVGDGRSVSDPLPSEQHFASTWRRNFSVAEVTCRATLPHLQAAKGCLLLVSSIAGLEAIGAPTDYSVAKTAVVSLTKQLARKLAPDVRVNCVAPGNVYFPGGSWDLKVRENPQKVDAMLSAMVPMKRFGSPAEIADAVVFLCSPRASFVTGAVLRVDGGQTVGLF